MEGCRSGRDLEVEVLGWCILGVKGSRCNLWPHYTFSFASYNRRKMNVSFKKSWWQKEALK